MPTKMNNEYGSITIENEVIARIAGCETMGCYGVVGMAAKNVKDGLVQLLKMESLTKGVRLNMAEGSLSVDLHIIVEYGTNITAIAESLMSAVKYRVEESAGVPVTAVNIFVEGIHV